MEKNKLDHCRFPSHKVFSFSIAIRQGSLLQILYFIATINLSSLQNRREYKLFFLSQSLPLGKKMFHINKQLVSSHHLPQFFFSLLLLPLSSLSPGERKLLAHVRGLLSQSWCTNLSDSNPGWSQCVCTCVCVYALVCVCVYVLTATCWVSLVLGVRWTDDTVTHVSRKHPVQSAVICNYLLTHTQEVRAVGYLWISLQWEIRKYMKWQHY